MNQRHYQCPPPDPRSCCQDGHGARQRDEVNIIVGTGGGGGGAKFLTDGLLEAARMIDGSPRDLEHDAEITHSPNTMVSPSRPSTSLGPAECELFLRLV